MDRIEFSVTDRSRWLTKAQLQEFCDDIKSKNPKFTIKKKTGGEHIYLMNWSDEFTKDIQKLARSKKYGYWFTPRQLARFMTLEDMYTHITGKQVP